MFIDTFILLFSAAHRLRWRPFMRCLPGSLPHPSAYFSFLFLSTVTPTSMIFFLNRARFFALVFHFCTPKSTRFNIQSQARSQGVRGVRRTPPPHLPKGPLLVTKWAKNGFFCRRVRGEVQKSPLFGSSRSSFGGSAPPKKSILATGLYRPIITILNIRKIQYAICRGSKCKPDCSFLFINCASVRVSFPSFIQINTKSCQWCSLFTLFHNRFCDFFTRGNLIEYAHF